MEEFNWKQDIKDRFKANIKAMPGEALSLLCFLLAMVIFFACQTKAQLETVQMLFLSQNWMVIGMCFIGIAGFSVIIEVILKGTYFLGKILFLLFKK